MCCSTISSAAYAGILVSRSAQGLQFTDAVAISFNTKDKALSLGDHPTVSGPLSKLPATHLNGMLLRDFDAGVLAHFEAGKAEYLLPQGLPKNAPDNAAAIWKTARISYKKSAQDKVGTDVAAADFVAFLPQGAEELTRLCMDDAALEVVGGKGKSFTAQMELMSAVVKAYASDPAIAPLGKFVEASMRRRYDRFESGADGVEALTQALKFAGLSEAVYPKQPEQVKLRLAIAGRKQWLDQKAAILRAFAAAEQWDAFLLGDREFERFQQSFPDIAARHDQALQESLQLHRAAAALRKDDGDYAGAFREYRLATYRKPSDSALREDAMQAWTEYSRRAATNIQASRARIQPGQQSTVERYLYNADQYRSGKKLDDALKSVLDAESFLGKALPPKAIAPETLKVLYRKADILGALDRTSEALATLDEYDLHAVDEERAVAEKLRNQLLFGLNAALKDVKAGVQAAWTDGRYTRAYQTAVQGLRMKPDDADLLYQAGMTALITRQPARSREHFTRYLAVSNTLDAKPLERAQVRRWLLSIAEAAPATQGDPNWLSGKPLPKGVFYCPVSLAFQPHISNIDASNKLKTTFEWDGEKLKAVTPTFEKNEHVTAERKIAFGYGNAAPQVDWVTDMEDVRAAAPTDPDEAYRRSSVLLLDNPYVDPLAIEKITGTNIAQGIAGNRFFSPFVWEKIYYFRLTYDPSGRVSRARELSGPKGTPGDLVLEFEWSGMQLNAIRGVQGNARVYQRTMQYQDGKLVAEEVQGPGKASHIKYTYSGNRLVSAESTNDPALDNRSRKVSFMGNSPSTLMK